MSKSFLHCEKNRSKMKHWEDAWNQLRKFGFWRGSNVKWFRKLDYEKAPSSTMKENDDEKISKAPTSPNEHQWVLRSLGFYYIFFYLFKESKLCCFPFCWLSISSKSFFFRSFAENLHNTKSQLCWFDLFLFHAHKKALNVSCEKTVCKRLWEILR